MQIEQRTAARGLLLTPSSRVLLIQMRLPWLGTIWLVPGGGMGPGESLQQTAAREVHEETGLANAPIGPVIWWRQVRIDLGEQRTEMQEHYFLVEVPEFEPTTSRLDEDERNWLLGYRWWHDSEIAASDDRFSPPELARLLRELLDDGPPSIPKQLVPQVHVAPDAEKPGP